MTRACMSLGFTALLVATMGGCTPDELVVKKVSERIIRPLCQAGCIVYTDDPNPDSVGVWMSDYFTPETCFGGAYDDIDGDGMGDQCEWALAKRFAPVMIFDANDVNGREPYWVARGANGLVTIGYFMAYYDDPGCTTYPLCGAFDAGHLGDSEAIRVDLWYNANSRHWVVIHVDLSEHSGYASFSSTSSVYYAAGLEYPTEVGGPFLVHVAFDKHANYETRDHCNSGAAGHDVCGNALMNGDTLYAGHERNLGSASHYLNNCVLSAANPYSGYQECFWTGDRFRGWQGYNGNDNDDDDYATPYTARLSNFGFIL